MIKVEKEFKKGTALIVGKDLGKTISTDGVVIYAAYSLSKGQPQLLDNAILPNEDIYICGHGSSKGTIGGRTMENIAEILVNSCGYRGEQIIHIMSCNSIKENEKKDMSCLLKVELKTILNKDIEVVSETKNTSILVDKDEETATFYDIKANLFFGALQKRLLKRHNLHGLQIEKSKYKEQLQNNYNKGKELVEKHNRSILIRGGNIMDVSNRFLAINTGLVLTLLSLGRLFLRAKHTEIAYLPLICLMLVMVLITNKYKRKEIIWKLHLISISIMTAIMYTFIAKIIYTQMEYTIKSLKVVFTVWGILNVAVICLGIYITDRYFD